MPTSEYSLGQIVQKGDPAGTWDIVSMDDSGIRFRLENRHWEYIRTLYAGYPLVVPQLPQDGLHVHFYAECDQHGTLFLEHVNPCVKPPLLPSPMRDSQPLSGKIAGVGADEHCLRFQYIIKLADPPQTEHRFFYYYKPGVHTNGVTAEFAFGQSVRVLPHPTYWHLNLDHAAPAWGVYPEQQRAPSPAPTKQTPNIVAPPVSASPRPSQAHPVLQVPPSRASRNPSPPMQAIHVPAVKVSPASNAAASRLRKLLPDARPVPKRKAAPSSSSSDSENTDKGGKGKNRPSRKKRDTHEERRA